MTKEPRRKGTSIRVKEEWWRLSSATISQRTAEGAVMRRSNSAFAAIFKLGCAVAFGARMRDSSLVRVLLGRTVRNN